jgi:PilZ domain
MIANPAAALVQHVRNPFFCDLERRGDDRQAVSLEATSQPVEGGGTVSWGAVVHDISTGGLGISLCYPFRPGTFLAVELQNLSGLSRTLMVRVLHVHDETDGRWRLGCGFVKPLSQSEMEQFK